MLQSGVLVHVSMRVKMTTATTTTTKTHTKKQQPQTNDLTRMCLRTTTKSENFAKYPCEHLNYLCDS